MMSVGSKRVVMAFAFCMAAFGLQATDPPEVGHTSPVGLMRGETTTLTFHGRHLEDAYAVLSMDGPGLTFGDVDAEENGQRLRVEVSVAEDCPIGEHRCRLLSERGWSYVQTLWVAAGTRLEEEDVQQATLSELPVVIEGSLPDEDRDLFHVWLEEGERLTVEVEAMRLGRRMLDTALNLYHPSGELLENVDDTKLLGNDPFLTFVAPEAGTYRVEIHEAAFQGDRRAHYRLHLGHWRRPLAVLPLGAPAGSEVDATFLFEDDSSETRRVSWPADRASLFYPDAPGPLPVRVSDLPIVGELSIAADLPLSAPVAIHGKLKAPGDTDQFRVELPAGQNIRAELYARRLGSPMDGVVEVLGPDGKRLKVKDNEEKLDQILTFKTDKDGLHEFRISEFSEGGGPWHFYRLEIAQPEPEVRLTLPSRRNNDPQDGQMIQIPRDGRVAKVFNLRRSRAPMPLELDWEHLPAGVNVTTAPIAAKTDRALVLFEATEANSSGGGYAEVQAVAAEDGKPLGSYHLDAHLTRQGNRGVYASTQVDQIPIAIGPKAPVRLEIDSPHSLITQGGELPLEVRVIRDEGFKENVTLRFPFTPPGLSAPPEIRVKRNEERVTLPIDAKKEAKPGRHSVVVTAHWGSQLETASEPFEIEIIEAWFAGRIERGSVEVGSTAKLAVKVENLRPFEGEATVELLGLPPGVQSEPIRIRHGENAAEFLLHASDEARPVRATSLFCQVTLPRPEGDLIQHFAQGGALRVDAP